MRASLRFVLSASAWSAALFAIVRLPWVETRLLTPLTAAQDRIAAWYGGPGSPGVVVTLSCSAADVIALCLGIVFAYPVAWRARVVGAAGALAVILPVNTLRILSLRSTVVPPTVFPLLHVFIWPAILTMTAAAYVGFWMRRADASPTATLPAFARFLVTTAACLAAFGAAVPWLMTSDTVRLAGTWMAGVAAALLTLAGSPAQATGPLLQTTAGPFLVTQECVATPLIPVYVAAVLMMRRSWPRRIAAVAAAVPLFAALGIGRLLLVALPPAVVGSPLFLVHGFYQLVAAGPIVAAAALWSARLRAGDALDRPEYGRAAGRAALACGAGLAVLIVVGPLYNALLAALARLARVLAPHTVVALTTLADVQGAFELMPMYQLALLTALALASGWRQWPRVGLAAALLLGSQVGVLAAAGEADAHLGMPPHPLVVRGWAVAGPALMFVALFTPPLRYRSFWTLVGDSFPDLGGAASTEYYLRNEQRLLTACLPALGGTRLLKTDLWDEAKNTRILQWADAQGAVVFGIDIAEPIVRDARAGFRSGRLRAAVADVRLLPFADDTFDAVYSMGTIEHFRESHVGAAEIYRVLKPGGRAIVGVPNRHDPFLRPLLVAGLHVCGLYAYGFERSFSRRALRRMLTSAGFQVTEETAILFVPGWLRMLDLALHTWCRPLAAVTRTALMPFVWLDRHLPAVRRHGYLLASVGVKPAERASRPGSP